MGLKIFGPGGIDQKSNSLMRDPRNLRDALNIRYSITKEYEKRPGTDIDSNFSGDNYSDVIFIKSLGEYFFRNGSDYYSYKNGVKKIIPICAINPTSDNASTISGAEYLNTFIFTHQNVPYGTFKYDGQSIYMAGLPAPVIKNIVQSGAVKTGFMLSYLSFTDASGIEVYGPSIITPVTNEIIAFDLDTLKGSGFYDKGITIAPSGPVSISPASLLTRTLDYSSISSDIVVGSKVAFRQSKIASSGFSCGFTGSFPTPTKSEYLTIYLIVESIDTAAKKIVFTEDSFSGTTITIANSTPYDYTITSGLVLRNYFSASETTGYSQNPSICNILVNNNIVIQPIGTLLFQDDSDFLLSDIYDITTSKLRPPKCKYITTYGDQLVYGGVISFFDFQNKESNYTNNDLVMYSDILTGDSGENVSEINRQLIGDTYDGQISGLIRVRDSLVVFKERSIYALDGILFPKLFSVRKIETNEVGCTADKSLLAVDGGVLFQGIDGIYSISGNSAVKVSGRIDLFFTDEVNPNFNNIVFDSSKTKSVVDNLNESYYFFTNKGVVVFNFEFKEWFLWDLTNAQNGLTIDNSNNIKMFSGSSAKKFIEAKNDSGTEITAWIKTAWFDFGEPSLLKKFIDIRYFSLNNVGQILASKIYRDWDETKSRDYFDIDMTLPSTKTILRKLDIQQAQSVSLFIGNNFVDEDLNLSGFELNGGIIQEVDKNV